MESLREWFDHFTEVTGEVPTWVVFGWGWRGDGESWPQLPDGLVPWSEVPDDLLDKEFDAGFGGNESPNLCAWSRSWVIFSDNYDGAEDLQWVPRTPTDHSPIRPGGG